jgi:hypothetical protein
MSNAISLVISNMLMKHFEKITLDMADFKPNKCLRYVYDAFMIWQNGPARLQQSAL